MEYFSSWEFRRFDSLPPGRLFFITPDTLFYLRRFVAPGLMHNGWGGWLGAVPCGKMEESSGGRAAVADCFLLSPGALGIIFMKRSACRSTALCHASRYDLHELHAVYQHVLCPQNSSFPLIYYSGNALNVTLRPGR